MHQIIHPERWLKQDGHRTGRTICKTTWQQIIYRDPYHPKTHLRGKEGRVLTGTGETFMRCDGQIRSRDLWLWHWPARPQGYITKKMGGRDRWGVKSEWGGRGQRECTTGEVRQKRIRVLRGISFTHWHYLHVKEKAVRAVRSAHGTFLCRTETASASLILPWPLDTDAAAGTLHRNITFFGIIVPVRALILCYAFLQDHVTPRSQGMWISIRFKSEWAHDFL